LLDRSGSHSRGPQSRRQLVGRFDEPPAQPLQQPLSPLLWLVVAAVVGAAIVFGARGWDRVPAPRETFETVAVAPGPGLDATDDHIISGPWYELTLTTPRFPTGNVTGGGLDDRLVALVNRSQRTLDVAIYEFNLRNVAEAIARAADRGVRVRMVTDSDTLADRDVATQGALDIVRRAGISIVADGRRGLMHHKFMVVDGEWVETGSANYTDREAYRNNNNAIVIQSRALAENYIAEFEKMFAGQFGGAKPRSTPHPIVSLVGSRIESYFSPEDRAATHVVRWMSAARQRIHFLAFSFTLDALGDAALQRARSGVEVGGVFEESGVANEFSEFGRLKEAGLDVLLDGNPWNLHHKVMVIDDRVSIFGSFNFSASADRENDENLLVVEDVGLATAFEQEYQRVRALAQNPVARR
jgi:phosphatidylserine/phosphatidylglycerophosphate/cardiolipin synthase-like enzyme